MIQMQFFELFSGPLNELTSKLKMASSHGVGFAGTV